jgi:hypothetical protein
MRSRDGVHSITHTMQVLGSMGMMRTVELDIPVPFREGGFFGPRPTIMPQPSQLMLLRDDNIGAPAEHQWANIEPQLAG